MTCFRGAELLSTPRSFAQKIAFNGHHRVIPKTGCSSLAKSRPKATAQRLLAMTPLDALSRLSFAPRLQPAISTSTCRSFATISSAACLFLAIDLILHPKIILQGGPLQRGRINATPAQSETSLSATRWIWAESPIIFREIAKMFLRKLQGRIGLRCYVLIATGASGRLKN